MVLASFVLSLINILIYTGSFMKEYLSSAQQVLEQQGVTPQGLSGAEAQKRLEKFGKNTPSIGFAVIIDELMSALSRQKIRTEAAHRNLIVYTEATEEQAIAMARSFRDKGRNIELLKRTAEEERSRYEEYARRKGTTVLLFLTDNGKIEMKNLRTGEERLADLNMTD